MSEPKSFASLGPMLLARKGTAKPAMRVHLEASDRTATLGDEFDELADSQADLGWNDMGGDDHVVPIRSAANAAPASSVPTSSKPSRAAQPRSRAKDDGRRAAFTLRLDAERHLKLRLASTINDCSAQMLVTEALDRMLDDIPELDAITRQVVRKTKQA